MAFVVPLPVYRWEKFAPGPVRVITADALSTAQRISVQAIKEKVREKKKQNMPPMLLCQL